MEDNKVTPIAAAGVVIDKGRAAEIVDDFYAWYLVEIDEESDESKTLKAIRRKLIAAVSRGHLEFEEGVSKKGLPTMNTVQHLRNGGPSSPVRYGEINGRAKLAMRGAKANDNAGQMHMMMGCLCGWGASAMADLHGPDNGLMESLAAFFSMV